MERLGQGSLSRRQAAKELDVGYATLKRLIDARLAAVQEDAMSSGPSTRMEQAERTVGDMALVPMESGIEQQRSLTDRIAEHQTLTFSLDNDIGRLTSGGRTPFLERPNKLGHDRKL